MSDMYVALSCGSVVVATDTYDKALDCAKKEAENRHEDKVYIYKQVAVVMVATKVTVLPPQEVKASR